MKRIFFLVALVAAVLVIAECRCAAQQVTLNSATSLISLELRDTPVRSAIDSLFKGTGINYAIEPGVTGTIPNLSLKDVTFDQALKTLVKAAGLTYRKDGQIYLISAKKAIDQTQVQPVAEAVDTAIETPEETERKVEKITMNFADAIDIANIFGVSGYTSRGAAFAFSGGYGNSGFGGGGFNNSMGNMGSGNSFGSGSRYGSGSYGNNSYGNSNYNGRMGF